MYRDEYARAGIRMLPVVEPDCRSTARRILAASLLLVPVSLLPGFSGMAGGIYLAGALLLGACFAWNGWKAARDRTLLRARGVLLASVLYLPALYLLMLLDRPRL
jgi:protoheme IX farnesyltransferase